MGFKEEWFSQKRIIAIERKKGQDQKWRENHPEVKETIKKWREARPEVIKKYSEKWNPEMNRKGGKNYVKKLRYMETGLQKNRNRVRGRDGKRYRPYKNIIAPESQLHHEWVANSADYRGVALVEKDQHMHGVIDVIQILEGKITFMEEIKSGVQNI